MGAQPRPALEESMAFKDDQFKALSADLPGPKVQTLDPDNGTDRNGNPRVYIGQAVCVSLFNKIFTGDWENVINDLKCTSEGQNANSNHEVSYVCHMTITAGGVTHHGIGGDCSSNKSLGEAHAMSAKAAATDALKRCAILFGWAAGMALYEPSDNRQHIDGEIPPFVGKNAGGGSYGGGGDKPSGGGSSHAPMKVCPDCDVAALIKGKEEWGGGYVCWKKARTPGCGHKFTAEQIDGPSETDEPKQTKIQTTLDKWGDYFIRQGITELQLIAAFGIRSRWNEETTRKMADICTLISGDGSDPIHPEDAIYQVTNVLVRVSD